MTTETGSCQCGKTEVRLDLHKPLNTFIPRACDCDFCRREQAAYVSHPKAKMQLVSDVVFEREHQGDNLAEFLRCGACHQLVAVTCEIDGQLRGTVNANLLHHRDALPAEETVSPRLLSGDEKLARWGMAWMQVEIENAQGC